MAKIVMMVDDDEATSYALNRELTLAGFGTMPFRETLSAWTATGTTSTTFDLLLTDIKFPAGQPHGFALAIHARILRPSLPVIVLSAFSEYQRLTLNNGYRFFLKPVDSISLIATIRTLLP